MPALKKVRWRTNSGSICITIIRVFDPAEELCLESGQQNLDTNTQTDYHYRV